MKLAKNILAPCAIGVLLLVPAVAAFLDHCSPSLRSWTQLGARELIGIRAVKAPPAPTFASFADRSFQRGFESWFNAHFGARNWLVRLNNQWLYSVFRRSNMDEDKIVVGENDSLFMQDALSNWVQPPHPGLEYETGAEKLAIVQKEAEKRGIPFVFVISADKALLHRELLPRQARRFPRNLFRREALLRALRSHGVRFVDGHEITERLVRSEGMQAFNPGGIHWNELAAVHTWNAAVRVLNEQVDLPFSEIRVSDVSFQEPDGHEADVWELMNLLAATPGFLVPSGTFRPSQSERAGRGVLVMEGGSFSTQLVGIADAAKIFDRIRFFYYARVLHERPGGKVRLSGRLRARLWRHETEIPDAILIEKNVGQTLADTTQFADALLSRLRELPERSARRNQSPRSSSSPAS